jgi:hypothetical protein
VGVAAPTGGNGSASGSAGYGDNGLVATASSNTKQGGSGAGGTYSGGGYTYIPWTTHVQYGAGGAIIKPLAVYPCPADQTAYVVYGPGGAYVGVICVPTPPPVTPGSGNPIMALAQQASSQQPWPNLGVNANPAAGLAGVPAWFWLGQGVAVIPPASATSGPITVTVRATLTDVVWDFGDGAAPFDSGSSTGRPYPQESDVTHIYQASTYGLPGGYLANVALRFSVEYSVNGGPWTTFGTKVRTYSTSYRVGQAQPEAVPAQ